MHNSHFEIRRQLGDSLLTISGRDEGEGAASLQFDLDAYLERQAQEKADDLYYSKSLPKESRADNTLPEDDADEEALADDGMDEGFAELSAEAVDEAEQDAPDYSLLQLDDGAASEELGLLLEADDREDGNQYLLECDQASDDDADDEDDEDEEETDDHCDFSDDKDDDSESEYEMPDLAGDVSTVIADADDPVETAALDDDSIQPPDFAEDEGVVLTLTDFFRNREKPVDDSVLQTQHSLRF